MGFRGSTVVKNPPAMQETWVRSQGQEDPLEKEMASTPGFLPGESHGQRIWWALVPLSSLDFLLHTHCYLL